MEKKLIKTPVFGSNDKQLDISVSEDESLLCPKETDFKSKINTKSFEFMHIKHLPTVFFVLFLMIFCLMIIQYLPQFLQTAHTKPLFKIKSKIVYFSEYFSIHNEFIRVLFITSQAIFIVFVISLYSLIKQRISVPELSSEKGKNFLIIIFSFVSVICLLGLTFFNESTLRFSKQTLNIVDNILFLNYLISSFAFCYLSYMILLKIEIVGIPKESSYLMAKRITLYLMGFSLILYFISLLLVSFYNPVIQIEKKLLTFLVISKEAISMLFIFNYLIFVLSLKYDLFYVHLNLQIRPDVEYFVDPDENYKSVF